MNLDEWASELNHRVYDEWKTQFSSWKQGFKVLHGPPLVRPSLMIISLNPGGDEGNFAQDRNKFENGDFSPAKEPPYLTRTSKFAARIRDLFGEHVQLLRETVAFPVCFFRSEGWDSIPRPIKNRMKQFCFPIAKEMIQMMPPKRILLIGLNTYNKVESILGGFKNERITVTRQKDKLSKLVRESRWETVPVLATAHLTGSRIGHYDWVEMKREFAWWLSNSA